MSGRLTLSGLLLGVLVAVTPAAGQSAPSNEECLACHAEDAGMTRADGSSVAVAADPFARSVHGSFGCTDCHTDLATVTEFPHPESLAPVMCGTCHDEPAAQLAGSVHGRRPHGGTALTCAACHGEPHRILPQSDPSSPTTKLRTADTCATCHGDQAAPQGMQGPAVARQFADSIHGQALTRSGLVVAPTCSDCHRSHDVLAKTATESPVFRTNVPATCGTCHAGIQSRFSRSVHATALGEGNPTAPHCASCHTAHAIGTTRRGQWQLDAVQQCGTCHAEALATYRDTFHGQVTRIGFEAVAKCADCHEPHHVLPPGDPASSVHASRLVATCGTCHTDANANFVRYQPHANEHDRERLPQLFYAARFMDVLMVGVFLFFGAHSTLWFMRERTGPADEEGDDA